MTDFFSNHYGPAVGATDHFTTQVNPRALVSPGLRHSRVRRSAAQLTVPNGQTMADNDVIRLLDLKSGDRLVQLLFSMDANWGSTADFNIGLYLKNGPANDGAVVDEDLFAGQIDWSGAITRVDYFDGANGSLDDWDRGKTLWELAAIGAGSDTSDPQVVYTVATTNSSNNSDAAAAVEFLCEAYYIAGD